METPEQTQKKFDLKTLEFLRDLVLLFLFYEHESQNKINDAAVIINGQKFTYQNNKFTPT